MFKHTNADENPDSGLQSSDLFSTARAPAALGHNKKIRVCDLEFDSEIHERRSCSQDDLIRASAHVANPDCWRPIPVIERDGGRVLAVDSMVFLASLLQLNPEAEVEIQFVTEAEALQIRDGNHQQRFAREKMAASRRAMLLSRAGWLQERIATLLRVTVPRVSQMIAEAKTEERNEDLAELIIDRHETPARFWSDVNGTRSACERADRENPVMSGPTRVERFDAKITAIVEQGSPVSLENLRASLGLNERRTKPQGRRARMLGAPVQVPGTGVEFKVARNRAGGSVINVPPNWPAEDFDQIVDLVLKFAARQARKRHADGAANRAAL